MIGLFHRRYFSRSFVYSAWGAEVLVVVQAHDVELRPVDRLERRRAVGQRPAEVPAGDLHGLPDERVQALEDLRELLGRQVREVRDPLQEVRAEYSEQLIAVGQIAESSRDAETARTWAAHKHQATLAELEDMFREGQEAGELGSFSPRVMAVSLTAALETTPAELMARPDTDVAAYADELATVFERAVRR